jgi:16S rRNA (guanine527-N7)-methyltransferase
MNRADFLNELQKISAQYSIVLDDEVADQLHIYYEELFTWNRRINLISRKEEDFFVKRHLVDSLCGLKLPIAKGSAVLDLGSGNGLPGIPLAIALPGVRIELLESRAKRCTFLQHVISRLDLRNAKVHCGRFEELYENLGRYQYILARGVRISKGMAGMMQQLLDPRGALVLFQAREQRVPSESSPANEVIEGVDGRRLTIIEDVLGFGSTL